MSQTPLRYDQMIDRALRGVVREALAETAIKGLPGDHHFYITFRTDEPGVELPDWLKAKYPRDITIVLQHEYWGLEAHPDRFLVTLSFSGQNVRLVVPYAALIGFADPSVKFGLQFQHEEVEGEPAPTPEPSPEPTSEPGEKVVTLDRFRKK